MASPAPIEFLGIPASPYTRKMLALLRYRRIPHRMIYGVARNVTDRPQTKIPMLPTFYLPNANGEIEAAIDSTPIIRRLEDDYAGRSVLPADPVVALIDFLLEDFGDEWLTKAMFHYRWTYQPDIELSGRILPRWQQPTASEDELIELGRAFCERQISRLYVVGSNETTLPVIEGSYKRFIALFAKHLEDHRYFLGARPAASDFAAYGQLTQLACFDPTPMAHTLAEAPRVYAWTGLMDDLSGLDVHDDGWIDRSAVPETLRNLLTEVGRGYVPVMLANARALQNGDEQVETEVDGLPWVQRPFPYQGKCVQWLRERYAALSAGDRTDFDRILAGTGCEPLFAGAA